MYKDYKSVWRYNRVEDSLYQAFTIIDTDFEETVQCASVWYAIMFVYTKRNIDPYRQLMLALINFTKDKSEFDIPDMIQWLSRQDSATVGVIDITKLNKYMILI